jgi:hypothetical protein
MRYTAYTSFSEYQTSSALKAYYKMLELGHFNTHVIKCNS